MIKLFKIFSLIILFWIVGFFIFIRIIPNQITDNYTHTDAIVVLTGGQLRLDVGIELLKSGIAKKLLITGVGPNATIYNLNMYTKSNLYLNKDEITLGHFASNTAENATEASIWMDLNQFKTLRLVTANYHLPRSVIEFKMAMPDKEII